MRHKNAPWKNALPGRLAVAAAALSGGTTTALSGHIRAALSGGTTAALHLSESDLQLYALKQVSAHSAYRAGKIFRKFVNIFDMAANRATPSEGTTRCGIRFLFLCGSILVETRCLRWSLAAFHLMIIGVGHGSSPPRDAAPATFPWKTRGFPKSISCSTVTEK